MVTRSWTVPAQEAVLEELFWYPQEPQLFLVDFSARSNNYTIRAFNHSSGEISCSIFDNRDKFPFDKKLIFYTEPSSSNANDNFTYSSRISLLRKQNRCYIECQNDEGESVSVRFSHLESDISKKYFILLRDVCLKAIYYAFDEESNARNSVFVGVGTDGDIEYISNKDQLEKYFHQDELKEDEIPLISYHINDSYKYKIVDQIKNSARSIQRIVQYERENIANGKIRTSVRIREKINDIYQAIQDANFRPDAGIDGVEDLQTAVYAARDLFPNDAFLNDCANNLLKILGDNVGIAAKNQQQLFLCR
jgi:hypothetical protein